MMGGASFEAGLAEAHCSSGVLEPTRVSLHKPPSLARLPSPTRCWSRMLEWRATLNLRSLRRQMIVGGRDGYCRAAA